MSKKRGQQLRLLLNIGKFDAKKLGLDKTQEGDTVSVDQETAEVLIKNGWAVAPGEEDDATIRTVPGGGIASQPGTAEFESTLDESPVVDENATQAIADIQKMRSREKLQSIVDTDQRVTVKEAAQKRLGEL